MFFPISGVEVSLWVPPLVAFVISFFTSMGGISGAFLLLPYQMTFLGYTAPSVSATNQLFNIVAIPSGVYRYCKEGRMVWPLTWIIILGTLPGVFIGAVVRVLYLPDPRYFKLFAACVLIYIGIRMVKSLMQMRRERASKVAARENVAKDTEIIGSQVRVTHLSWTRMCYSFNETGFEVSIISLFMLSLVVGVVGGIYGIGGGSIITPFLVTFFGLPVHTVAGAALMGTFVTSVAGVIFYQAIAPFFPETAVSPDWALGLLFGLGGMLGIYFGARCQKYVSATHIKLMLAVVIIFTAVKYIADFILS
ncbi:MULTISPECIES: sulfite exporter TauE/SafE family protein [Desulfosediminicola]|uniref:sulfite exporter TauE/SafE family protein n=1 Tax=Desulfosediminicola TaxID=2886823 RepID=UPI0010ABB4D0|nr:sulfite exporter TauE/SafE family protein [Desulfosediminicola ganghwensis]